MSAGGSATCQGSIIILDIYEAQSNIKWQLTYVYKVENRKLAMQVLILN